MLKNPTWVFIPYSDSMLDETINAFDHLVDAIESRLPGTIILEGDGVRYGLVDESTLQSLEPLQGFAHKFLLRARRPRFQMIAPGLEVPTLSTISKQPFGSHLMNGTGYPPILLLRAKHACRTTHHCMSRGYIWVQRIRLKMMFVSSYRLELELMALRE